MSYRCSGHASFPTASLGIALRPAPDLLHHSPQLPSLPCRSVGLSLPTPSFPSGSVWQGRVINEDLCLQRASKTKPARS